MLSIPPDDRARENCDYDCEPGQVLDAPIAESEPLARLLAGEPKGNPERYRGRSIPKIVNCVGKQRDAAGEEDHRQLQNGRGGETDERPFDRPQPPPAGRDRGVDDPMCMAMAERMVMPIVVGMVMRMVVPAIIHCRTPWPALVNVVPAIPTSCFGRDSPAKRA